MLYAKSLHIYGFRCFSKAVLQLQYPGRKGTGASRISNVNLILGNNGEGKSSILRALAIAMLGPTLVESGFVPYYLVRRPNANEALVKAVVVPSLSKGPSSRQLTNEPELLVHIKRGAEPSNNYLDNFHFGSMSTTEFGYSDRSRALFVVGYGAARRPETGDYSEGAARKVRSPRYNRIAGLFEDHVTLRPMQSWLGQLSENRQREAVMVINKALPEKIRFAGEYKRRQGQYLFLFEGQSIPFSALSDGYKAFIGLLGDLVSHICDDCPTGTRIDAFPGVVLIDEIDLHLHPEWQQSVIPKLSAAFPKIQFVATSHSPLSASTVFRENVFVTEIDDEHGGTTITQLAESIHARSVDQLLLSPYFHLKRVRPKLFDTAAEKLFQDAANGDSAAAVRYLEMLINPNLDH